MADKNVDPSHDGIIKVKLTPRASKNEITGIMDDGTIKIRLTAPPVDGKANQALLVFLADVLTLASSKIRIISGQTSHTKLISVSGLTRDEMIQQFQRKFTI
jgi:uncharacterized protein